MTAVTGHLTEMAFPDSHKQWKYPPPESLFSAPVLTQIHEASLCRSYLPPSTNTPEQEKKTIAANIESQARYARSLVIWTDCDREGEYIGHEIRSAARRGNGQIEIKRARFSNIERA